MTTRDAPAPSEVTKSVAGPFVVPAASAVPLTERRTWEGYASDFRDLTAQLAALQQQHNALLTEASDLHSLYQGVQAQRQDDQRRLALIDRARRTLEASSTAQTARVRAAQNALAASQAATADREEACHRATTESERRGVELEAMRARYEDLEKANAALIETVRSNEQVVPPIMLPPPPPPAFRAASGRTDLSILDRIIASLSLRRARAAARAECWEQAAALYEVVLLVRDEPRLWVQLGNMLREQKRYTAAAAAYRRAVCGDPRNAEIHARLGLAEAARGDDVAAHEAYSQALQLDPGLAAIFGELQAFSQANAI